MKIKHPKKSLGQNFLTDKNVADIIVNIGDIKKNDTVLEVGPGTGNLTEKILSKNPRKIFAIEKDKSLVKKLHERFREKIILINDDILKIDEKKYSKDPMIVFGNLPYNISTQILIKWIRYNNLNNTFKKFILMFQKEVAERIISKHGMKSYGRLSIMCQIYCKVNIKLIIPKHMFYPQPKVDSAFVIFNRYSNDLPDINNFSNFIQQAFSQRRKKLKNNLTKAHKRGLLDKWAHLRPEELSPKDYLQLYKRI